MPTKPRKMPDDQTVSGLKQIIASLKRKKSGTQLAKRRRAEAIERYEKQWLPQLERQEAEAAHEARLKQIQENGRRIQAEANQPVQAETKPEPRQEIAPPTKRKRRVFHFLNADTYYCRGGMGDLVQLQVRRSNGRFYDMADGEELEAIPTGPQPCRGATLLDDGEWRLPEVKTPTSERPKPDNQFAIPIIFNPMRRAAEQHAQKIRDKGYQPRITNHDSIEVLYDFQWIPLHQWKQIMGVEI